MTSAETYIEKALHHMPRATPLRSHIALELRGHIAERLAAGHSLDEVLRQLGDPVKLAESYLSAVPLVSATFPRRAVAKVIDFLTLLLVLGASMFVAWQSLPEEIAAFAILFAILVGSLLFWVYTAVAECWVGQTLGKYLLGIRAVRESGARISFGQAIVRHLPFFLQVFAIDALFALFTDKSQRAFELLSKTRVVRASSPGPMTPAMVLCLMLGVGASARAQSAEMGPPPGKLVDVGGRKIHMHCSGAGAPTVVLEAGASSFAIDWSLVQPEIARANRVCSYDRAGHGWSDPSTTANDSTAVGDLHAALQASGEKPPYVMVGASRGGLYVRLYQIRYPDEVAGLVLVDPAHEDRLFTMFQGDGVAIASLTAEQLRSTIRPGTVRVPRRSAQTGTPFEKLGADLYARRLALDRRRIAAIPESLSYEARLEWSESERASLALLHHHATSGEHPLGDRPVIVLTRGVDASQEMKDVQGSLARLSTNSRHTVVEGAGHEIHLFEPGAVIQAIRDVVEAARGKTRLPGRMGQASCPKCQRIFDGMNLETNPTDNRLYTVK